MRCSFNEVSSWVKKVSGCRCGTRKKRNLRKDYRPNSLNPLFGQMIEMEIEIPMEKNLVVSVMDHHHIFSGIWVFVA